MKKIFSRKSSFGKMDTDLILRNMIFSVLYVSAILTFFSYVLWPTILKFKSQYIIERKEKIIYNEIKKGYDTSLQRIVDFRDENKPSLAKFYDTQTFDDIKAAISQYLTIIDIKSSPEIINKEEETKSISYIFKTQTDNVEKVWQLISKFDELNASIVINPPIQIQRANIQSGVYSVVFGIEVKQNAFEVKKRTQEILQAESSDAGKAK
ncbi:hypothetical protein BKN38_07420 [Helicobacter sp. CLO-3]|uniref:hypothetical protein n=1 Tax=unclassified Helicobacter TaxID=2593540 RepID=UPI00080504A6|nr:MULTISPECIES: hypothetical protein [unclassified Helicobacter]OBV29064.1 hypothetical protein BA723_07060 [Helicobacter sp. CLO-3]OHU82259.1 hypothetical protein BKN38_07420 [Helicobacter sp. CLO-3]